MHLIPHSYGVDLREYNDCHEPAGQSSGGQFCSKGGDSVPPEPGTTPIPPGMIRGYHYVNEHGTGGGQPAFDSVLTHGLDLKFARGSSYGEPNAIWFSTAKPGDYKSYVEVFLRPDEIMYGPSSHRSPGGDHEFSQAEIDRFNASGANFVARGISIPPDRFVTHHRPWHDRYRYLQKHWPPDAPETWREAMMGKKTPDEVVADFLSIKGADYIPAVKLWAEQYEAAKRRRGV